MRSLELPKSWRGRALIVTGVEDPDSWFSEEELRQADAFRLQKRRLEWKLSRIAAKKLAADLGLPPAPMEMRRIGSAWLSLSHSAPYAAAAIDSAPVGIDIETIRDLSERAAHLFLADDEIAIMRGCALQYRLLHFWAAKEAEWKRHGGTIATLRRVPLQFLEVSAEGLRFDRVETRLIGDVVAALTLPTS